jgi:hypothetical protein
VARTWQQVSGPFTNETINDLWGSSSTNVYGVGSGGTVFHYDGNRWDSVASTGGPDLNAVWGSHPSDVYAVGDSGVVLHYNGSDWQTEDKLTDARLEDISGISLNKVVVVGRQGTILSYDGIQWTADTVGENPAYISMTGVYVAPNGRIFVCGYGNIEGVYEYTLGELSLTFYTTWMLMGISGTSDHNMIFHDIDGGVFHYDGTGAEREWPGILGYIQDVFFVTDNLAYSVHTSGSIGVWQDGQWSWFAEGTRASRSLWVANEQNIYTCGIAGAIDHFDGTRWTPMINDAITHHQLNDVWYDPQGEVFVVGDSGSVFHYDGGKWSAMDTGVDFPLLAIWGQNASDVWAVGGSPTDSSDGCGVLHFDGAEWSVAFRPEAKDLFSVSGNAQGQLYVAGRNSNYRATVYRHDQNGWTTVFENTESWSPLSIWTADSLLTYLVSGPYALEYDGQTWQDLTDTGFVSPFYSWRGIWGASRDFVIAWGSGGLAVVFDGNAWHWLYEVYGPVNDAWGLSPQSFVVVGQGIHSFEGGEWTSLNSSPFVEMTGVSGTPDGDIVVVGERGTILMYFR